jgi:hypothetical protein
MNPSHFAHVAFAAPRGQPAASLGHLDLPQIGRARLAIAADGLTDILVRRQRRGVRSVSPVESR